MRTLLLVIVFLAQVPNTITNQTGTVTSQSSSSGHTLSGRFKRDSGEPAAAGLTATLIGINQNSNAQVKADGTFEFSNIRPGAYSVSLSILGFPRQSVEISDKDITGLEFVVPWMVEVSGTINVEGDGIRPIVPLSFSRGTRGGASTSARDSFHLTLAEDSYRVSAGPLAPGYFVKSMTAGTTDLLSEPMKLTRSLAPPPIIVTIGILSPPPGVRLSGRITGLKIPANANTRISFRNELVETIYVPLGQDGAFDIPRILPGRYDVGISSGSPTNLTLNVVVPNSDSRDMEIVFPPFKVITGRVAVDGGTPVPLSSLTLNGRFGSPTIVSSREASAQQLPSLQRPDFMTVNLSIRPDGTFNASLPEGRYRIDASSDYQSPGMQSIYSLKTFTYGTSDLLKNPAVITASDTSELVLTFAPRTPLVTSKVRGRVTGISPEFLKEGALSVSMNGDGARLHVTTVVQSDGSFEFSGVYPGRYVAYPVATNTQDRRIGTQDLYDMSAGVDVAGSDVDDVTLAVPQVKTIFGHVVLEDRAPLPRFSFPLNSTRANAYGYLIPQTSGSRLSTNFALDVSPTLDGKFFTFILEGDQRVGSPVGLPAGYAVKSLTYGTTDLLKDPLNVSMSDSKEFVLTLTATTVPTFRVSGRMRTLEGETFYERSATANLSAINFASSLDVSVKDDGTFEFPEVFPGKYTLRLSGVSGGIPSTVPVTVEGVDVRNLEVVVSQQKQIPGRMTVNGGGPLPRLLFRLNSAGGASPVPSTVMNFTPQADGSFLTTVLEGDWSLSLRDGLPAGYSITSLTYGTTDLLKSPLIVRNANSDQLHVTLSYSEVRPAQ